MTFEVTMISLLSKFKRLSANILVYFWGKVLGIYLGALHSLSLPPRNLELGPVLASFLKELQIKRFGMTVFYCGHKELEELSEERD